MVRLYLPPSLRHFEPMRVLPRAHREFMSLEYDLVEALRPRLVVDLGAGDAQTFFTLCQSLRDHDVDGLCYAVDEWSDDSSKAEDDESRYAFINHFAHNEMRGIAYLLQMSAESVRMHFDTGAIDLLRLDVRRFEQSAAELIETWLPRVAVGGVALIPGTATPALHPLRALLDRPGVRRWDLDAGEGLTLLYVPGEEAEDVEMPELVRMAFLGAGVDQQALAQWYAHADEHLRMRAVVRGARWGLGVKKNPRKQ